MPSSEDHLLGAYRDALYDVDVGRGRITLRVNQPSPALEALLEETGAEEWAYLTAHNPRSQRLSAEENASRQATLERELTSRGLRFFPGRGHSADDHWSEASVLICGIARDSAIALAHIWDQAGLLVGVRGAAAELVLLLKSGPREAAMTQSARGPFEVKLAPVPVSEVAAQSQLGRMSIDKRFSGDLEAASQGEMLAFRSAVNGSAGYVAMERVEGRLHGRRGSFVLQHSSTLSRGVPSQSITVVPDSGTDELVGLSGTMVVAVTDGKHSYTFEYRLG